MATRPISVPVPVPVPAPAYPLQVLHAAALRREGSGRGGVPKPFPNFADSTRGLFCECFYQSLAVVQILVWGKQERAAMPAARANRLMGAM